MDRQERIIVRIALVASLSACSGAPDPRSPEGQLAGVYELLRFNSSLLSNPTLLSSTLTLSHDGRMSQVCVEFDHSIREAKGTWSERDGTIAINGILDCIGAWPDAMARRRFAELPFTLGVKPIIRMNPNVDVIYFQSSTGEISSLQPWS